MLSIKYLYGSIRSEWIEYVKLDNGNINQEIDGLYGRSLENQEMYRRAYDINVKQECSKRVPGGGLIHLDINNSNCNATTELLQWREEISKVIKRAGFQKNDKRIYPHKDFMEFIRKYESGELSSEK